MAKVAVRQTLRRAVLRMQNRRMALAFDAMQSWSARRGRGRALAARCVCRLAHLAMGRALSALWAYRCRCVKVRKAVGRMRYRMASACFEAWWDGVLCAGVERERVEAARHREKFHAEMRAAEQVMGERVVRASARRWMHRGASKCLDAWCQFVGKRQLRMSVVSTAVQRWNSVYRW